MAISPGIKPAGITRRGPDHCWWSCGELRLGIELGGAPLRRASSRVLVLPAARALPVLAGAAGLASTLSVTNSGSLGVEVVDLLHKPLAYSRFRLLNQREQLLADLLEVLRLRVRHGP